MKKLEENSTKKLKKRSIFHKIVNGFIGFFLGLFLLILLIIGFSQTSYFRSILREQVIKIANSSLNGTINIGKIDGTIFSSLILSDVTVNMKSDTLLNSKLIEVRVSPLQILYKKIYARKIYIEGAKIGLLKDTSGALNISKLFKPKEKDTTKSSFPFKIKVAELKLANIDFSLQDESKKNSVEFYDSMNMSDLRIKNLNLSLSATADIDNNDFEAYINNVSFGANINRFELADFKGDFLINPKRIIIGGVRIKTRESEINLSVKNEGLNIFGAITKDSVNKSITDLELDLKKFSFNDLSIFVPSINYLKGEVEASLKASGNISQIEIKKLALNYLDTKLNCSGSLKNISAGSKMFIAANFKKSYINENDVNKLIAGLNLPIYKNLDKVKIDTLNFEGEPLNFKAKLKAVFTEGSINTALKIDLRPKDIIYDLNFITRDLNLEPILKLKTKLNSTGKITGQGTSPNTIKADVNLTADASYLGGDRFDSFKLIANAENKLATLKLFAVAGETKMDVNGQLDFTDANNPGYTVNSLFKKLNLAPILNDSTMQSDLNFTFDIKGQGFNPDKLTCRARLKLAESSFTGYNVDSTELRFRIADSLNERVVKLNSELANIAFRGKFSVKNIVGLVLDQTQLVKNEIFKKINQFYPSLKLTAQTSGEAVAKPALSNTMKNDSVYVNYVIQFKDFSFLSKFFNSAQFEIDGKIDGRYSSGPDGMKLQTNTNINYFQFVTDTTSLLISGLKCDLFFSDDFKTLSSKDIKSTINFTTDKISTSSDIQKIKLNAELKNDLLTFKAAADYETKYSGAVSGLVDVAGDAIDLKLDTLKFNYDKLKVQNSGAIDITLHDNKYDVKSLVLAAGKAKFSVSGIADNQGDQNLVVNFTASNIKDILKYINGEENNITDAKVNLNAKITGTFASPIIGTELKIDSIIFKDKNFGNLSCLASYKEKNAVFDVKFSDLTRSDSVTKFSMKGNLPIDLAFAGVEKRLLDDENLKIKILFNDFDLTPLSNAIPKISELQGKVKADLNFEGPMKKLNRSGYLTLTNCSFFSETNYIAYTAGLKLTLSNDVLSVDEISLANKNDVKNKGTLKGWGKAMFDGYDISNAEVHVNGDLTVLSDESKNALSAFYGDLFIGTNGDAVYTYDKGKMFLNAQLIIKKADITFPPYQTNLRNSSDKFVYKYVTYNDTVKVTKKGGVQKIKAAIVKDSAVVSSKEKQAFDMSFDYNIGIKIKDDSRIVFLISKEANQRLTAILSGDLKYERNNGIVNTQGELKLLDGSTLEFIKTLDATGSIRFESDLTNPNLDIAATYIHSYTPDSQESSSSSEKEVEVKIKLSGPLNDLGKNLKDDNISVYMGSDAIKNNEPDRTKTLSDAAYFILTNKFPNGYLNTGDATTSTASALAGNLVGGVLNAYFGDAVNAVDVNSTSNGYQFNLSGKIKSFKYTIGGSSTTMSDLSKANVKIERSLFDNFILRLERKLPVGENTTSTEMKDELGIKYRFEF